MLKKKEKKNNYKLFSRKKSSNFIHLWRI